MNGSVFVSMNIFGHEMLKGVLENNINVSRIYTLDKSKIKHISDYKDFSRIAEKYNIEVVCVRDINAHIAEIEELEPGYIFIFGWPQILDEKFFQIPKHGCIGSHPSLLPRNRGRAVISWHFINEEKHGGITVFFLGKGCDDGDIIAQKKFKIAESDNAKTYYDKIVQLGREIIDESSDRILSGTLRGIKQKEKDANYLLIRTKEDSFLDFSRMTTRQIFNQIRAVAHVYPAAFFFYKGKEICCYNSGVVPEQYYIYSAVPGQIIKLGCNSIWVKTSDGIIELKDVRDEENNPIDCEKYFKTGRCFNRR